jgi:hypothetical protein
MPKSNSFLSNHSLTAELMYWPRFHQLHAVQDLVQDTYDPARSVSANSDVQPNSIHSLDLSRSANLFVFEYAVTQLGSQIQPVRVAN